MVEQLVQGAKVGPADIPMGLFRMAMEVNGADQRSAEQQDRFSTLCRIQRCSSYGARDTFE